MDGDTRSLSVPSWGDALMPLLRLFRAAIGREPTGSGLRPLLDAHRRGISLAALARDLLLTAEGQALHGGPDGIADTAFCRRIIQAASGHNSLNAGGLVAGLVGMNKVEALATLAATPLFHDDPPGLPALFADRRPDDPEAYAYWCRWHEPMGEPVRPSTLSGETVVALVMRVGDSTAERASSTIQSLQAQSYPHWRLTMAGTVLSRWTGETLARLTDDPRVVLLPRPATSGGPGLRAVVRQAGAGAAGALTPGDRLAVHALGHVVALLDADPAASLVFTDEDVLDPVVGRSQPRFKTALNLDAMLAGDAIGRLAVFRASLLDRLPDAATDYDLALQACLADPAGVRHLPRVLLHAAEARHDWPMSPTDPRGADSVAVVAGPWPRLLPPAVDGVLVTVIVLTRDRADLLQVVTDGLLRRTVHAPLELLIVDHASTEPDAVALLAELARNERVQVLPFAEPFNFSAMNNRAAALARGELLLLLNNDIEILHPEWLSEMAGHALRPDVGLVGARLLHRDGSLQHGGIVLGPEGRATHLHRGAARDDPGYLGQLAITRDVAAVTGACMAIRRNVYQAVGGMNEAFPVTWNDVDLCQRVRRAGLRVIWTPHAVLTHLEGETRGRDDDPGRHAAFLADGARYRALWGDAADVDPFLNPSLVATDTELCLAPPRLPRGVLP